MKPTNLRDGFWKRVPTAKRFASLNTNFFRFNRFNRLLLYDAFTLNVEQVWYSDRLKQWWKEIYDDQVGELYFYNEISNETRSDLAVYKEGTIHWAKCEGKR